MHAPRREMLPTRARKLPHVWRHGRPFSSAASEPIRRTRQRVIVVDDELGQPLMESAFRTIGIEGLHAETGDRAALDCRLPPHRASRAPTFTRAVRTGSRSHASCGTTAAPVVVCTASRPMDADPRRRPDATPVFHDDGALRANLSRAAERQRAGRSRTSPSRDVLTGSPDEAS